ncbi:MAG: hypothetical protein L6R35_002041 [Caloplaca aegaea]|nr:MAG: hypothetical protein L6R35_002041 [Caloplaca aegaea]
MTDPEEDLRPEVPLPIFQISQKVKRYQLYDIKAVTWLRRTHNILGVLIGGLPQSPQQNVFLGLPLELQPEEVRLLVETGIAYIVDDLKTHESALRSVPRQLEKHKEILRKEGMAAARAFEKQKQQKTKEVLQRLSVRQPTPDLEIATNGDDSLFDTPLSRNTTRKAPNLVPYFSTPTTSYPPFPAPPQHSPPLLPDVSRPSYALFNHLHSKGYFLSPGLRFGCQFSVYPGDPLRFHSHFLATSADWDEELELLDLVGGGRLGTGVKKGWLIGGVEEGPVNDDTKHGSVTESMGSGEEETAGEKVRTFCIEWGGM